MQSHPTRSAIDLAIAGIVVLAMGIAVGKAVLVAWGGCLLLGLQIARGFTLHSVSRVRNAGFEMLWAETALKARGALNEPIELKAEVRNRDNRAARYVGLRALCSPFLDIRIHPIAGEVPASGRLGVTVTVTPKRVGRHGIFALSLEIQGSPGLYEVPLTFSNPFGIETMPRAYAHYTHSAMGGRNRQGSESQRSALRAGGAYQIREIRDYVPGDPFRRIAWKASGRRGKLMTREYDLEEREVVWLFLDASVELWAGQAGRSPLDTAIDAIAGIAEQHLRQGDQVGLGIIGHRRLAWLRPNAGASHAASLMETLACATGVHDSDRSGYDEDEVAARVLEHLRPLDPHLAHGVSLRRLARLAQRAELALKRAPFDTKPPVAPTNRERTLRQYLANFGIDTPARLEPDRPRTDVQLLEALREVTRGKGSASAVYLCGPAPGPARQRFIAELKKLRVRRCAVRWVSLPPDAGVTAPANAREAATRRAAHWRALAANEFSQQNLPLAHIMLMPAREHRGRPSRRGAMSDPVPLIKNRPSNS